MSQSDPNADHWRLLFPPTEFLAWQEFKGRDVTLTIKRVEQDQVQVAGTSKKEKVPVIHFEETPKKLSLNKTNARAMTRLFGTWKTSAWVGKKVTLYPEPNVYFGRDKVGGIRVRDDAKGVAK